VSHPFRLLLATLTGSAALLLPAAGAPAQAAAPAGFEALAPRSALEQISRYTVAMDVRRDGSMRVTETIDYDFGSSQGKHGIFRTIPTVFPYDDTRERVYPIDDVDVSSPTGAPDDTKVEDGKVTSIRIGDADKTVSGRQTYVLTYDVGGVVNSFGDHQELYWNAIGTEWSVTIGQAAATVKGPAAVQKTACYRGSQGSTQTCRTTIANGVASFSQPQLAPAEAMTVVASFPVGTFPGAEPILREPQTLARAFTVSPLTVGGSLAVLALAAGGAYALVTRRGRDERYLGVTPGLEPGTGQEHTVSRVPLVGRDPIAVQFQPPKDMRPGQLGTLIDERANVVDVTATIVDLAVRGFLRIEEVERSGWFRSGDWRLVMVSPAPAQDISGYELRLLQGIFDDRSEVLLSQLKKTFRSDLEKVQEMLYDDVTSRGWFRGNPVSVRLRWQVYGIVLALAGAGLTWLLATRTTFGLLGLAVAAGGLVLLLVAPRMPARTAKGTAALAQAKGFREYLETAEADQIRFEEGEDIFSRYLPFAIVFGVAERWAKVFQDLAERGVDVGAPSWYGGNYYAGTVFNYAAFGSAVNSFSTETSGSIAAATPSSSGSSGFGGGGFSGGGGGGGGGGSW
jgi:uncharacterized protein (TIGR04222 family)